MPRPAHAIPDTPACASAAVGSSDAIKRLRSQVERIAPYYRTALITGIPGTNKEGIARMLHALSPSASCEFIGCEATALAESMLRGEGEDILEACYGGTLFLDDIGEVPAALQSALLRILSTTTRHKIRVIAGTHRDLRTMGVTGQFRTDLSQRLMGVEIAITPLRERPEDLPAVIAEALRKIGGDRELTLAPPALDRLLQHGWPGDVAEIEKTLFDAARTAEDSTLLDLQHLPALYMDEEPATPGVQMDRLQDVVQQHVLSVLTRCAGNKLRAAELLGISRSTLYRMLESRVGDAFSAF